MDIVLIIMIAILVVALLGGFWVLSKVGFGPTDDSSAHDDEDVGNSTR